MFTHPGTAATQEGVVPLLSLPGSIQAVVSPGETDDQRVAVLHHSEFGWDCRLEGAYPTPRGPGPGAQGRRRLILALLTLGLLAAAAIVIAVQPGGIQAPGSIVNRVHDTVAGWFSHRGTAGGGAPAAVATARPTATPAPTPTPAPLPVTDGTPPPPPPSTPSPAATPAGGGAAPAPLHLTGQYSIAAGGAASTTCASGRTSRGLCTWSVSVQAGNPLYLNLTWANRSTLAMKVTSGGATLFDSTSAAGNLNAAFAQPPATMIVTVAWTAGTGAFDLALGTHP